MKSFSEFIFIAETTASEAGQWKKMNDADFEKWVSRLGTEGERENMRRARARVKARTQNVSGQDIRGSGSNQTPPRQPSGSTQTPPKQQQAPRQEPPKATQTPPKQPSGSTQTPPKGTQTGTQTPPKQPSGTSGSQQTPSPGRNPNPYRNTHYKGSGGAGKPPSGPPNLATTPKAAPKGPGLRSRLGKLANPAGSAVSAGIDYKERRDAGQSRQRAAGGALSSLAGYAKGAEYGAKLGAKLPIPAPMWVKAGAGGLIGGTYGQQGASAAYDFAADKSRPARQAVSKATGFDKFQQKNALIKQGSGLQKAQQTVDTRFTRAASSAYGTKKGSALTGIGGKTVTSKDEKGNAFMSTGAGKQRQTVQLSKTQLVRDPKTGKQVVGDLAFKGGKATYLARPSVASRDTSLGARVGRALNIGRYSKEAEQQAAKQEYRTALKNTQTYQKKLGITPKAATAQNLPARGVGPAKVGPKLVGPKLVGSKIVGPTKPQSPTKPLIKPA
jgi:hypothetical protein